MKYDVFISCKSEDYHYALPIHHFLTDQGLTVFLADIELRKKGRDVYGEIIDAALESADHLIVLTSKASYVDTTYVKSEWRTFVEEKRSGRKIGNIITILKGVAIADLPIALRSVQSFTYKDYRSAIDYLSGTDKQKNIVMQPPPPPSPIPKPYPKWLWALALMPLVLVGLWLGIDTYQEKQQLLREQQAQEQAIAEAKAEAERIVQIVEEGKGRNGVYQVGDYYNHDGEQGVVFAVSDGGRHGKIVSLTQSRQKWCSDEEYKRRIETGASDQTNGLNNQRKITQISGWREKYPAFAWCADQGEGWYLPAIEELKMLLLDDAVHDAVNRALEANGATRLFNRDDLALYWSSNEYYDWDARFVRFGYGYTQIAKSYIGYVRAVSTF